MQYTDIQAFSEMTAALYSGPFESSRWESFLQLLMQNCDADTVMIGLSRPGPGYAGVVFWKSKVNAGDALWYGTYAELDPFVNLPDGEALTIHQLSPQEEFEQSPFYQECLLPLNIRFMLGIDIHKDDQVAIYLRLARGSNSKDFGDTEKSLLNALYPHFKNLVTWLGKLEDLDSERSIYETVVSHLALGTVVVDNDGAVIKTNPIADFILNSGEELYIEQGRLACRSPMLNRSLKKMMASANSSSSPGLVESLTVRRINAPTPLYLTIKPRMTSEFTGDLIAAHNIIFINAVEMQVTGSLDALQEMLGLTKAEARMAIELANGLTVVEISEKLQVSNNTVRTHISRIYQKSNVNNQTAIVKMVLRCIASLK